MRLEGLRALRQTRFFKLIVRCNNALHERVPHHVAGRQAADRNILHAVSYLDGFLEAADLIAREVDLGNIAGDDDL